MTSIKTKIFNFVATAFLPAVVCAYAFSLFGTESPKVYHAYMTGKQVIEGQPMVAGACDVISHSR